MPKFTRKQTYIFEGTTGEFKFVNVLKSTVTKEIND